jgi:hypothetical protein
MWHRLISISGSRIDNYRAVGRRTLASLAIDQVHRIISKLAFLSASPIYGDLGLDRSRGTAAAGSRDT